MKKINIKSFETMYSINDDGVIINIKNGRELKGSLSNNGYIRVTIFGERYLKHRVIAKKYLPKVKKKKYINHIDGNKLNNNKSNLEWCTMSENIQHAFNTGLKTPNISSRCGEKNANATLTEVQVSAIRKEVNMTALELANKYNTSKSTIRHILKNRSWVHLLSKNTKPIILKNKRIKLSFIIADEIRKKVSNGVKQIDLAILYKVNRDVISKIIRNKTWKTRN